MATENMEAARLLFDQKKWRSAISRAYYAAFASAHAIGLHAGEKPRPPFGTWTHRSLPGVLHQGIRRIAGEDRRSLRSVLVRHLEQVQRMRGIADYQPMVIVGREEARDSIHQAARIVSNARSMIDAQR